MYQPLPAFTTLTDDFRGTLDHIFISAHMTPCAHLEMFSEETIFEEKSLPSSRYPSDHMACMALFSLDTV
jgi:mRNA deadenylase 3'-5' endonuclease subunit Ccr4